MLSNVLILFHLYCCSKHKLSMILTVNVAKLAHFVMSTFWFKISAKYLTLFFSLGGNWFLLPPLIEQCSIANQIMLKRNWVIHHSGREVHEIIISDCLTYVDTSQVLCDVLFLSLSWKLCNNLHKVLTEFWNIMPLL